MRHLMVSILFCGLVAQGRLVTHADDSQRSGRSPVLQVRLDDEAITPITARFIERAVRQAEQARAECLIIVLDTPGGLVDSTRSLVKSILSSDVPVVVYVAPSGARAASAGVFITLASHVAAMAPGTNIGAAHPVSIGGLPITPPQSPSPSPKETTKEDRGNHTSESARSTAPADDKIVNDTTAWARSLAELRRRNSDWAERAVRESLSVSADDAVRERVVDFLARDLNDLLAQLDGREVQLDRGTVRLSTVGAPLRTHEMWWGEQILLVISNPNVAFLLLIFGFYGILFELYSPGWGVAGTLGVICLVIGFFALAILPINYVGLLLIALALGMFVAEAFVTSYGALTLGGVVCMVLGGLMLVDSPIGFLRVSLWTVLPVAAATALVTVFLVGRIVATHRTRVQTGSKVSMVEVKHVDLPDTMKRAMARQAESERERRAKVIHADGEFQAAAKLRDAAETIEEHPMAMQMRFLQTLSEVGAENNTTIVFPVPLDLISPLLDGASRNGTPRRRPPAEPVLQHEDAET